MKKYICLITVMLLLSGCTTSLPTVGNETREPASVTNETTITMLEQINLGDTIIDGNIINGNIIEVPQLVTSKPSAAADAINEKILDFAGDYKSYMMPSGPDDFSWIELICYPFIGERYAQIVMTRNEYPTYGTDGDLATFTYDMQSDTEVTLQEASKKDDLDAFAVEFIEDETTEEATVEEITPVGFLLDEDGGATRYFFEAYIGHKDSEGWKSCYTRMPDGRFLQFLGFTIDELMEMDSPLYYASDYRDVLGDTWACWDYDTKEEIAALSIEEDGNCEISFVDDGSPIDGKWTKYINVLYFEFDGLPPVFTGYSKHLTGINIGVSPPSRSRDFYLFQEPEHPTIKTASGIVITAYNHSQSDPLPADPDLEGSAPMATFDEYVPQFSGFPDEKKQTEINTALQNEVSADLESYLSELRDMWDMAENDDYYSAGLYYDVSYKYMGEDGRVLQIGKYSDYYLGGAHGTQGATYSLYDIDQTKRLALGDLFTASAINNGEAANALFRGIDTVFETGTESLSKEDFEDISYPESIDMKAQDYYIQDGNLILVYQPYEIASYATGIVEFPIPMRDLSGVLRPEYKGLRFES
ncbi:MAG: DUF3298 and DUF4163 domain-containing protein [Clostridiales Family XIII bacterium]|jgi:hypothetical protein|nr:DUF3298 and DUF4163 domain-containing protein [Clostridiales Family XIII bacterium]